ncbi:MAG: DUF1573 domain-containing protein [Planctomyces sp.]
MNCANAVEQRTCRWMTAFPRILVFLFAGALSAGCSDSSADKSQIPGLLPNSDSIPASESDKISTEAVAKQESEPDKSKPTASATGPWPKVKVEAVKYNFGRMPVGDTIGNHEFLLENVGDADLILKAGEATCQCTTFKVERELVPPGESTKVIVNWQTVHANEQFRHGGPVYTNDPAKPEVQFEVQGVIDEAFVAEPSLIWDAGTLRDKEVTKVSARISSRVYKDFRIDSLESDSPQVTVEARPLTPAELQPTEFLSGYEIITSISPDVPVGSFRSKVTMKIDVQKSSRTFRVHAMKSGPIRFISAPGDFFEPDRMLLKLGNFRAKDGKKGRVMLIVNHTDLPEDLKIVEVAAKPAYLKASLVSEGTRLGNGSQRYFLTVEIPPGHSKRDAMSDHAEVKITTNHPKSESVILDVSYNSN